MRSFCAPRFRRSMWLCLVVCTVASVASRPAPGSDPAGGKRAPDRQHHLARHRRLFYGSRQRDALGNSIGPRGSSDSRDFLCQRGTDWCSRVRSYTQSWTAVAAGTYSLVAVAVDSQGGRTRSAPVSITVGAPTAHWNAVFGASADHATNVTSYRIDVFASGADPSSAPALLTSSLGKPTPNASNIINVDETGVLSTLPPGSYISTITAIGPGGQSRSAVASFIR